MKKAIKLAALVGAVTVICATFAACGTNKSTIEQNTASKPETNNTTTITTDSNNNNNNNNETVTPAVNFVQGPGFTKTTLNKNTSTSYATPWENSPDNKMSACLVGKGTDAKEEGIAKIYLKDSTGNMWQLALSDDKNQNTPMYIKWWDDNNLLVIIGYGYGTVSLGGNLYLLNIDSAKTALLVENKDASGKPDPKQQVVKAVRDNNDIKYDVAVYEDSSLNKYHVENRVLSSYADTIKGIEAGLK